MSLEPIVPLTAAHVRGPLGVKHLPRFWLKGILRATGRLPAGYRSVEAADELLLTGIGLDPAAASAQLERLPRYAAFEAWVRSSASRLDADSIARLNAALEAEPSVLHEALADWERVHTDIAARRGTRIERVLPAVSMQSRGALGVMHLPRLWMKATLAAGDALHEDWRSGRPSGFDVWFTGAVGLDLDRAIDYVHAELPPYPQFESWAAEHAERLSAPEIAQHNNVILQREKPEAVAAPERAVLGIDDPAYRPSVELNDLVDWHWLHGIVTTGR